MPVRERRSRFTCPGEISLEAGGCALIKVFQGAGFQELVAESRQKFAKVKLQKPDASRSRSAELYLLAKGFLMV